MDRDLHGEEQQKPCNVCEQVPENIICLSCSHSICLMCAAKIVLTANDAVNSSHQPDANELECPVCGAATLISEEVKAAFNEIIENPDFSLGGAGEEEHEEYLRAEDTSQGNRRESQPDLPIIHTSDGEEEETEPQETFEDQTNEDGDRKGGDYDEKAFRKEMKNGFSFDNLTKMSCQDHLEELYTHYSPILRRLLCPQCIIELQPRQIEHNAKPIRRCHG